MIFHDLKIENVDDKIELIKSNLIEMKKLEDGTFEFVIIVYDDKYFQRDVEMGLVVDEAFPSLRDEYSKTLKENVPHNVENVISYDAMLKGKKVVITEYHIPTHSKYVPPLKYIYECPDPMFNKVTELSPQEEKPESALTDGEKAFISDLFGDEKSENPFPANLKEKFEISESDYWKHEKEYLRNEDADFPYFVASLLNTYGFDNVVLEETPRVSAYDIIFCHIVKCTKQVSSLKFIPEMNRLHKAGFISLPFSENVLTRALSSTNAEKILKDLLSLSATPFIGIDKEFAVDSSGFTSASYSQWYRQKYDIPSKESVVKRSRHSQYIADAKEEQREEKEYVRKPWLKASIVSGRTTHAVFALDLTDSHGKGTGDPSRFEKVVSVATKFFVHEDTILTADRAYNTKEAYDFAEDKGFRFICEFKKNQKGTTDCHAMNKAYHYRYAHADLFKRFYGGRNNVESVFNAIKVKTGERVYANSDTARFNEMRCKMIAYNIMVLIRLYYMCGISIEFKEKKASVCT